MGRRSASESVVALFVAFVDEPTWTQAALARRLGVTVPVVRKRLSELIEAGCPLERQEEHPHVYWSMRKGWMPGGVTLTGPDLGITLRLLARTPQTPAREQLLAKLLRVSPATTEGLTTNSTPGIDESIVATLEDSAQRRQAVRFRYVSTSRGEHGTRHASIHRVDYGPPLRFVATCHRSDRLKWFRGDNVVSAAIDPDEQFRAPRESVDAFQLASIGGFAGDTEPTDCSFIVRSPVAAWARRNLPAGGLTVEHRPDGAISVQGRVRGVDALARFVVGLGGAATCTSPLLAATVSDLARGALEANASS